MNDSKWMSEGLAKLGLVQWPKMPPPSSACLRYRLNQLLRYISTCLARSGPQRCQMANGSSDQLSEEIRGKMQKFTFVIFTSDILTYKTQKQMIEIFEFGLINILENLWKQITDDLDI